MNTAIATAGPRPVTRLDQFAAEILTPDKREQLMRSLPKHIRPELFERNLLNALMVQPDLLKCHPSEVFREVALIAALGLYLDPALGEAYLIVGFSKADGRHKPQRRVGYRGLVKLARQSGEVSQIYAHEVRANDELDANLGLDKRFDHRPKLFAERGEVIGFYAVVKYRDGSDDFEAMSLADVNRIRDRSDAWRAWKSGKVKRPPPWETDAIEMGKKTVIRRLVKRVPQSPELLEALKVDREDGEPAEIEQLARPRGRPRLANVLQHEQRPSEELPPDPPEEELEEDPENPDRDAIDHDPETGEITGGAAASAAERERELLVEQLTDKAHQGTKKLRWFKARLRPDQLALVADWSPYEQLAKLADEPPRAERQEAGEEP